MDNYITGSAIRQLRERKGITQADLAEQLNVSPKTI
ncbi:MAG: helix-turn-helix transcriptional regulator, partial [Oscillospiraceae bacterium]|nr:helix-turn-helix transcriptional regulator [Oscillospiraceae bacterium]